METNGRIRRIGDGLFIEVSPEVLRESGLSEGQAVRVDVKPADDTARDFASGFTTLYDEALRNLSNR